jgi:hypothetical protein
VKRSFDFHLRHRRHNPQSLGSALLSALVILLISLPFVVVPSFAAPLRQGTIHKIYITDVRDVSFVVSWTTDSPSTGSVNYGTTPSLGSSAADILNPTSTTTHYVILSGLNPNTTYYFDVAAGSLIDNNGGAHYTVTTGPTLGGAPGTTIYGQVFQPDGTTGLDNAIVYLQVQRTGGNSQWASARTSSGGFWSYNLDNLRTGNNQSKFNPAAGETIQIIAQGGALGTASLSPPVPASTSSVGNATLDGIPNGSPFQQEPTAVELTRFVAGSSSVPVGVSLVGVNVFVTVCLFFWQRRKGHRSVRLARLDKQR